ncbi:MTH538 TIR-like domain [Anaerovibrio lipolyticus DSM 3074]|uniref:MTH538 TIR-like domain n=1 Tax=Anaerovibrio lipolyticus DSM 3074 TaxID=1120997 RepID=A0A1M6FGF8_9FIRM|nr:TIR domain-containing protein [Anaerovibrio lipolyticus]SHI96800.1 MTH538 TIR-like domain [Anaerovibrio lipolyticus DSM 3074]
MGNRTANYAAFYVAEPFDESNLGANATPDFVYYNQLRAWKARDSSFPFVDAHSKTYSVRDNSKWETLKQRLHERLDVSKNIILFLSRHTKNSRALHEEIDYGINNKGLPVIVIYPDFKEKSDIAGYSGIKQQVRDLWDNLPVFRNSMRNVATIHVPYQKKLIEDALKYDNFKVTSMSNIDAYYFKY